MSDASRAHYERLVRSDGFVEFFRRVTPIAQIGTLPIASRPVARGLDASTDLDDLRAIPWVFAWSQSRVNLTGWYGLGAGLAEVASRRGGVGRLRAMATAWPFFATLLENAELSLAKADPAIADLYLARGDRPDLVGAIRDELAGPPSWCSAVSGHANLLDGKPDLQRRSSIGTRTSTRCRSSRCASCTSRRRVRRRSDSSRRRSAAWPRACRTPAEAPAGREVFGLTTRRRPPLAAERRRRDPGRKAWSASGGRAPSRPRRASARARAPSARTSVPSTRTSPTVRRSRGCRCRARRAGTSHRCAPRSPRITRSRGHAPDGSASWRPLRRTRS